MFDSQPIFEIVTSFMSCLKWDFRIDNFIQKVNNKELLTFRISLPLFSISGSFYNSLRS